MKAIILAGGFGTRLGDIVQDIPKPMISIAGKPFLEHQIDLLKEHGITEIILAVYHMSDKIKSYFADGGRFGVKITYSEEDFPLGTAGAIKNAAKYIDGTFLVLNGDTYSHINLRELIDFHNSKNSKSTMVLTKSKEPSDYGNVILNGDKITDFIEKPSKELGRQIINAGVYVFEKEILRDIEENKNISLEKEIFPRLARMNILNGYYYEGYFMDIGRPETHAKFKEDVLNALILRETHKVRDAMSKIAKNKINLVLITDINKKLLGVINERMIRDYLLKGGNVDDYLSSAMIKNPTTAKTTDDKNKINNLLFEVGIHHLPIVDELGIIKAVEFHSEKIKQENFPVIRGRSPLRISFAGGGTDLPDFFQNHGGIIISSTIDKYCYATLKKRADSKILIDSDMTPEIEIFVNSIDNLAYNGKFDIIKAIVKIMKPDFGFDLYLRNDIPPGRGLGSSASISVLLIKMLSSLMNLNYDDYKIAEIAFKAEREELEINGGWQDQYAAVTGGFNYIEFDKEKNLIYPLRLKQEIIEELTHHLLLCYVGNSHFSGEQQSSLAESIMQNDFEKIESLKNLRSLAIKIKDSLLTNNLEKLGLLLHDSWEEKRRSNRKVSNLYIDELYNLGIENGAIGGKLLGSGGGGYILFFCKPEKRNKLVKSLNERGVEILSFNFEFSGTKIWRGM